MDLRLNIEKAKSRISTTSYEKVGYKMIDYGETIINGLSVYFKEYIKL